MAHYFDNETTIDQPGQISFALEGHDFELETNRGVFSKDRLDTGTRILLETVLKEQPPVSSVLDLGCGIGVIGVVLSVCWNARITAIDVSQRACALAEKNLQAVGADYEVLNQDGIREGSYPLILLNPPIRTGKAVIYRLFDEALAHLEPGGALWIVIRKQHGAASALKYLSERALAKRVYRDKGFWILRVEVKADKR